jgi:hypothetical protein
MGHPNWAGCDIWVPRGVCQIVGTKDCGLLFRTEYFWEPLGGCPRGDIPPCVGLPCKVLNQLVVGLSPLSETTYPTGQEIPNDGS